MGSPLGGSPALGRFDPTSPSSLRHLLGRKATIPPADRYGLRSEAIAARYHGETYAVGQSESQ